MQHMIIGDAHSKPGTNNTRFDLAGQLAVEHKPDAIIDIGDWFDMPSLSSYDVGKKTFEGRRFNKDLEVGHAAYERFDAPIAAYNSRRKPADQYHPRKYRLGGNHSEGRLSRVINDHAELDGVLTHAMFDHDGWQSVPYLEPININGIMYAHYFISGIMGRAISGEHPATSLLNKMHVSCIAGHSHLWDYSERVRADGRRICAMVAGCYFEHYEGYAGQANKMWWRGISFANNIVAGSFDPGRISLTAMRKRT